MDFSPVYQIVGVFSFASEISMNGFLRKVNEGSELIYLRFCLGSQPTNCSQIMENKEGDDSSGYERDSILKPHKSRLSCTKYFDALWFCYSPYHQMKQYYRYGYLDNCSGKWSLLFDCLTLKTKRSEEIEKILQDREKSKSHIWTYRTVEEASENWWHMYHHFFNDSAAKPKSDA